MIEDNGALVVTLIVEVLEKDGGAFRKHLDHHLKSDNWIKQANFEQIYLKNNYIMEPSLNLERANIYFVEDMQALFDASTNKEILAHTTSAEPLRGIAQLANLGHVVFQVSFNASEKKYIVKSDCIQSYGENDDVFAAFEK